MRPERVLKQDINVKAPKTKQQRDIGAVGRGIQTIGYRNGIQEEV